ncbi:MAG: ABC transporter ATP-binding protein [Wenzhouxiangellaceae bacterium]|nr:ABC transporter ATP-binding protein [Wenzhouxiangellaceae bacterium]
MTTAPATPNTPILEVTDLAVDFASRRGRLPAVEGISLTLNAGETLAIVGESGSGKSVTALALMGLIPKPPGIIRSGTALYRGRDLLTLTEPELRRLRGQSIAMIFQEPMTSLNPVMKVGHQIMESVMLHTGADRRSARARALEMLERVQIADAARRLDAYPHELSGGMRQRVMIALALACDPDILIADEPTTALDVTVQAEVLEVMRAAGEETGTAILLITHDLGVVAEMADRVLVVYAGRSMEAGPVREVLRHPRHPYTRGLLASMPRLQRADPDDRPARLAEIPGQVPAPGEAPPGCPFAGRCEHALQRCHDEPQILTPQGSPEHRAACWRAGELGEPHD